MKNAYRIPEESELENLGYDSNYWDVNKILIGPGDFECNLGEPEDCIWCRDGAGAINRLNEQHDLLVKSLDVIVDAIEHGMPITQDIADLRNNIIRLTK